MPGDRVDVAIEVELAHEAPVQPPQLLLVEDRRGAADALDREALDELVGREDRRVVVGAPAEQGEVVADRGRQIAGLAQLLTEAAPWRFESFLPSGPWSSGRCA